MSALRERNTVAVKKDELYGKSSLSIEEEDDGLSYFVSKLTPRGISLPGPDELFHATISDPYWTSVDSELAIKRANYYWKVLASEGFYSDQREFDEFGLELFPFRHEVIPCNTVRNWSLHHELATFALSKGLENNNLTLIEILRANVECDCKQGIMYEKAGDTVFTKHDIGEPYYLTIKASNDRVYEAQVFCPSVSGNQILEKGIGPSSFEELGVELIQFRPALYYPEIKNPSARR
ncbi:hypothetical protein TorRG33x02_192200 [Trema orientale]|uniref:Uncharacterized protein n=1 Tax=Trema orientale TaxID=63057 RepID=A0A2P5EHE1_TREOI|nr:hypothetical protein TorRG33x02_192200 [Trema orientale]